METGKFYSIGVVSRMLGITQQTIRFYEQRGLISPTRTTGNTRLFSEEDVKTIRLVQQLSHELGVNLAGIEIILRMNKQITQLQVEHQQLLAMLLEAGQMVKSMLKSTQSSSGLIKSSTGILVKLTEPSDR
jgi:MerR family transcriptional regulator, heat shock protein HspR